MKNKNEYFFFGKNLAFAKANPKKNDEHWLTKMTRGGGGYYSVLL